MSAPRYLRIATLAALVLAAACSSSAEGEATPVFALYGKQAETRLSPYPSNRYTRTDATSPTGLRVDLRADATTDPAIGAFPSAIAALNRLDGFSTIGPIILGFSREIDPMGSERALALVDVDDASPSRGQSIPLVTVYYTTTDTDSELRDYTLLAHPVVPLRPRTRYAFVATDGIVGVDGAHVRATEETRALLRDEPGEYAESVRRALPLVAQNGVKKDTIVLASVFTTASVRDEIEAMAASRRANPSPRLVAPFTLDRPASPSDARARFVARYEAPEYRRPKPLGTWAIEGGKPVVQSMASIETYLVFSDAARSGPRPIVIFGHGLGSDKDTTWGTAERLAALGVAVIGIDAPEHGARSDPPTPDGQTSLVQSVKGFFAADPDAKTFDMERVRDNFRQMASDQLELVRLISTLGTLDVLPIGAPDGVPDLDTTKILYLGHSFGSVFGATIGALAPEIRAACWNVGGDGLLTLMRDSSLFSVIVNAFRPPGTPTADVAKFFAITQAIVDPGDPANYARYATLEPMNGVPSWRPLDVLVQEVEGDTIVPNSATEILARAAGLAHVGAPTHDVPGLTKIAAPVRANLPSGATGGLYQYATTEGKLATHGELIFTTEAKRQYVEFFRTALEGRATIVAP